MKASEDLLDSLHGLLAKELIDKLKSGEASPADISAAIRFLKDNNVVADMTHSPVLQELTEETIDITDLPFEVAEE